MPTRPNRLASHAQWAAPPLFPGDWRDFALHEAVPFLMSAARRLGASADATLGAGWPTRVRAMRPPFYPGWLLAEVQLALHDGQTGLLHLLYGEPGVAVFTGQSPVIHAINAGGHLRLETPESAASYLRFFCSMVHSTEGRFAFVERRADLFGRGVARRGGKVTARVQQAIAPLVVSKRRGRFRAQVVTRYGVDVFHTTYALPPTGIVEMLEDKPLGVLTMTPEVFRSPHWIVPPPPPAQPESQDAVAKK